MPKSTQPLIINENYITLTNSEYSQLKQKYFELNPNATMLDVGLHINNFGFSRRMGLNKNDDFLHLFEIVDSKKYEYSRIKYEF
jgi:hypothetical protein